MSEWSIKISGVIVHIVAGGGLYGLERVLLNLLPALHRKGTAVTLVSLVTNAEEGVEIAPALEARGVKSVVIRGEWMGRAAMDQLRSLGATAFHVHGYKATVVGGLYAWRLRRPLFATYHAEAGAAVHFTNGFLRRARFRAWFKVESLVLRRARAIAAVSDRIRNELISRGARPLRVVVVPNGIRPTSAAPDASLRHFPFQLVIAGRLVRGKNVRTAIEAIAEVRKTFPGCGLVVAGTGPDEVSLRAHANALGVAAAVVFAGYVSKLGDLLASSDCLVMPSSTEGMPLVILEAMEARLAIVASSVGAIPEVVRHEREGLIVPPADAGALAANVLRLQADTKLRARLQAAAYERFLAQYTDDAMAARYDALYKHALGDRARAVPGGADTVVPPR